MAYVVHVRFVIRRFAVELVNALARSVRWLSKSRSKPDHSLSIYGRGSQPGVHFPIWREKRISKYLYIYLWILFSNIITCLLVNIFTLRQKILWVHSGNGLETFWLCYFYRRSKLDWGKHVSARADLKRSLNILIFW